MKSEFLIKAVLDATETLAKNYDRSPHNPIITDTLTRLVSLLADDYNGKTKKRVLKDPRVHNVKPRLLSYLSEAEAEMEKFWADAFLSREHIDLSSLQDFWYIDNYENLVDKEIDSLSAKGGKANKETHIAFIGSGALPLTAIIYHLKTGAPVTCIDLDPAAVEKSQTLLDRLGLKQVKTLKANGSDLNFDEYNQVFIASLVPNENKKTIIKKINETNKDILIAVRSAEGLSTLLYEPINEKSDGYKETHFIAKTDTDKSVINTTLWFYSPAEEIKKENTPSFSRAASIF
jgi:precorrin-6B methylase 2